MDATNVIAVDLGASSGRLMSGTYDGQRITVKEQFRFSNLPVQVIQDLNWDYMKLLSEIKYGLNVAHQDLEVFDSLAIDTWGVDYALLNANNQVLLAPHSYRDTRVDGFEQAMYQQITPFELFQKTGNQPAKINTVLQLFSDLKRNPFLADEIDRVLFMPNFMSYLLSGQSQNEFTIASTSGLLDTHTRGFSDSVLEKLGLKRDWFQELIKGGAVLGTLLPDIQADLHLQRPLNILTGAGHDTAAALLALPIPQEERGHTAFISSGTWSIIGRQTPAPVVSEAAFKAGLTNEGCFDGSNRLLANLTGLWIIQELQREWAFQGRMVDFAEMTQEAADAPSLGSYINPNHGWFGQPGHMSEKIHRYLELTEQQQPESKGQLVRVVLESLALAYRQILTDIEQATNEAIRSIHMFGGGIQNQLLVQLTADYTTKPIAAGPVEASALGNAVSQLQTLGLLTKAQTPQVLKQSFPITTVMPRAVPNLAEKYEHFLQVVKMDGQFVDPIFEAD